MPTKKEVKGLVILRDEVQAQDLLELLIVLKSMRGYCFRVRVEKDSQLSA